jgi:hypothetical protein
MKDKIIICDCTSSEHQIVVRFDKDFSDKYREVFLDIHLITYKNIFKRIWISVKYICAYKCRYGHWDEIIITKDNYKPLKKIIKFLEK